MRRLLVFLSALLCFGVIALAQQSLGDAARDLKKKKGEEKKQTRTYTNDNLPTSSTISVIGTQAPAENAAAKDADKSASSGKKEEDIAKPQGEWRQRIAGAKKEVAELQADLDLLRRQNRARAGLYWGLTDAEKRMKEDEADVAEKQKQLDAAKQRLDDLRDQGRKAGMPPGVLE